MSKQLDSILSRATTTTPRKQTPVPDSKSDTAPAKVTTLKPALKPSAEPQKSINVYVPFSVAKALNVMAAQEEVTVRSLVLRGLKEIGIDVSDNEIRDKRK
ncbi:MAG: hypothetical protein ACE360_04105 [Hyphomicrobiales bacterium]